METKRKRWEKKQHRHHSTNGRRRRWLLPGPEIDTSYHSQPQPQPQPIFTNPNNIHHSEFIQKIPKQSHLHQEYQVQPTAYSTQTTASIQWDHSGTGNVDSENNVKRNRWCLTLETSSKSPQVLSRICTEEVPSILSDPRVYPYFSELPLSPPPSGVWGDVNDNIEVQCYLGGDNFVVNTPSIMNPDIIMSSMGYTYGDQQILKKKHRHYNVEWNIFKLPSTLLLMSLHIFIYRYQRERSGISNNLSYYTVIQQGHLWRIAATFSHFNLRHLCLNLYMLYVLGATLEHSFGSTPFLYTNLALVLLVTAFTLLVIHLRLKWFSKDITTASSTTASLMNEKIVLGYSSICCAWIMVLCLDDRPEIPIAPFLYVTTTYINLIPMTVLLICHLICPRESSFLSHFAGFAVGLLLHWDIPSKAVLVPHLLLPAVLCADYYFLRRNSTTTDDANFCLISKAETATTVTESLGATESGNNIEQTYEIVPPMVTSNSTLPPSVAMLQSKNQKQHDTIMNIPVESRHGIFLHNLNRVMIVISFVGVFGLDHAMGLSQIIVTLLFRFAIMSYFKSNILDSSANTVNGHFGSTDTEGKRVTDIIMRRYFLSVTVLNVVDAMTVGSWVLSRIFILSNSSIFLSEWKMKLFFIIKLLTNLIGMVVVASILEVNDDFVNLLGNVFENAKLIGNWILFDFANVWQRWRISRNNFGVSNTDTIQNNGNDRGDGTGNSLKSTTMDGLNHTVSSGSNIALKRFMI